MSATAVTGSALALLIIIGLALPALPGRVGALTEPGANLITRLLAYEITLFGIGLCAALALCALVPGTSPGPFSLGTLDAPVSRVPVLGLGTSEGATWRHEIVTMTLVITAVTTIFVWLASRTHFSWQRAFDHVPWILLFAALNAAGEEWFYRVALLRDARPVVSLELACLVSAIVFGLAHVGGRPGGIGGVIAAALLGFVLSRATLETDGIATAWVVHFLQDVVIFAGWLGTAPTLSGASG